MTSLGHLIICQQRLILFSRLFYPSSIIINSGKVQIVLQKFAKHP